METHLHRYSLVALGLMLGALAIIFVLLPGVGVLIAAAFIPFVVIRWLAHQERMRAIKDAVNRYR